MHFHRLILEKGAPTDEWVLRWDDKSLVLENPDGQVVIESDPSSAHRLFDLLELFGDGKIAFSLSGRNIAFSKAGPPLNFQKHPEAVAELQALVRAALASDQAFRAELWGRYLYTLPLGLAALCVCGGLFGLYCWYVSWAPDPPPGHWIRWFARVIHFVLLLLLGLGLAGARVTWFSVRQLLLLRSIEKSIAQGQAPR